MDIANLPTITEDSSLRDLLDSVGDFDFGSSNPLDTSENTALRNAYRASHTVEALRVYGETCNETDEPAEQVIADLLGDLMHMADLMGVSFDGMYNRAEMHHDAEKMGE